MAEETIILQTLVDVLPLLCLSLRFWRRCCAPACQPAGLWCCVFIGILLLHKYWLKLWWIYCPLKAVRLWVQKQAPELPCCLLKMVEFSRNPSLGSRCVLTTIHVNTCYLCHRWQAVKIIERCSQIWPGDLELRGPYYWILVLFTPRKETYAKNSILTSHLYFDSSFCHTEWHVPFSLWIPGEKRIIHCSARGFI